MSDKINKEEDENPIVFISYSWDDEPHKKWVLDFANKLRSDGVDVILDRYHLTPGANLSFFVEDSLRKSNRIILVLTPNYKGKAEQRKGGVGQEYSIINTETVKNIANNERVIPILRKGSSDDSIPIFFQQYIYVDFTNDSTFDNSYEELIREIYKEPKEKIPDLGKKPNFDDAEPTKSIPNQNSSGNIRSQVPSQVPSNLGPQSTTIQTIKELISKGKISNAFEGLEKLAGTDSDLKNDIILLKARHSRLERDKRLGVISSSDANISTNQIVHSLLSLLDGI